MFIGVLLLAMGLLMVLERLDIIYGSVWDWIWPIALIALGVDFITKHRKER